MFASREGPVLATPRLAFQSLLLLISLFVLPSLYYSDQYDYLLIVSFSYFLFFSVTDLTRKIGEESMVYQRPLPRYPINKLPVMRAMVDGPEFAPQTLIDKFRRFVIYIILLFNCCNWYCCSVRMFH